MSGNGAHLVSGVAKDMRENALAGLPLVEKKILIKLMARIAESSYRRGFQHGVELPSPGREIVDPVQLRFFTSLDIAPTTLRGHRYCCSAIARLYMEHHVLHALGIGEFAIWPDGYDKHTRSPRSLARSKPGSAP